MKLQKRKCALSAVILIALLFIGFLYSGHGDPRTRFNAFFGSAPAQLKIARLSFTEGEQPKDEKAGAYWTKRAAKNDYPAARGLLGILYMTGIGVRQDFEAAQKWLLSSDDPQAVALGVEIQKMNESFDAMPEEERRKAKEAYGREMAEKLRKSFDILLAEARKKDKEEEK